MPSTLVVAGAAFLGGMATSSLDNSTKSRILADTKTGATLATSRLAARKKMSGGTEYEKNYAEGRARGLRDCKAHHVLGGILDRPGGGYAAGYDKGKYECWIEGEVPGEAFSDSPSFLRTTKPRFATHTIPVEAQQNAPVSQVWKVPPNPGINVAGDWRNW